MRAAKLPEVQIVEALGALCNMSNAGLLAFSNETLVQAQVRHCDLPVLVLVCFYIHSVFYFAAFGCSRCSILAGMA